MHELERELVRLYLISGDGKPRYAPCVVCDGATAKTKKVFASTTIICDVKDIPVKYGTGALWFSPSNLMKLYAIDSKKQDAITFPELREVQLSHGNLGAISAELEAYIESSSLRIVLSGLVPQLTALFSDLGKTERKRARLQVDDAILMFDCIGDTLVLTSVAAQLYLGYDLVRKKPPASAADEEEEEEEEEDEPFDAEKFLEGSGASEKKRKRSTVAAGSPEEGAEVVPTRKQAVAESMKRKMEILTYTQNPMGLRGHAFYEDVTRQADLAPILQRCGEFTDLTLQTYMNKAAAEFPGNKSIFAISPFMMNAILTALGDPTAVSTYKPDIDFKKDKDDWAWMLRSLFYRQREDESVKFALADVDFVFVPMHLPGHWTSLLLYRPFDPTVADDIPLMFYMDSYLNRYNLGHGAAEAKLVLRLFEALQEIDPENLRINPRRPQFVPARVPLQPKGSSLCGWYTANFYRTALQIVTEHGSDGLLKSLSNNDARVYDGSRALTTAYLTLKQARDTLVDVAEHIGTLSKEPLTKEERDALVHLALGFQANKHGS